MGEYQLCMFDVTRNIHYIKVLDYMIFKGINSFRFGNKNIITGDNGTGKSTLCKVIYISMGVDSLRWYDLSLFTYDKTISVQGSFSTGIGTRKRRYRENPLCYYGLQSTDMKKVDLQTYKKLVGLYDRQRTLF